MAIIEPTDSTTTVTVSAGDILYVARTVDITVASGIGIVANSGATPSNLTILGTVVAFTNHAIQINNNGSQVYIGSTARIISGFDNVSFDYGAIEINGDDVTVTNYGEIAGPEAIEFKGDGTTFTNFGTLTATSDSGSGIFYFASDNNLLINHGTISVNGILNQSSTGNEIINTGLISLGTGKMDFDFGNGGLTLTNSGSITGFAPGQLIETGDGADEIDNSGLIGGTLDTDTGVDVVVNSGEIMGEVRLGADGDTFRNIRDGFVEGVIRGDAGNDSIVGGSLGELIDGGTDNDTIKSAGGDDTIDGGIGDDLILSGSGDDDVVGGDGADTIRTGADNDTVLGGLGNDSLRGENGNDDLNGQGDNDTIKGGAGDDTITGDTGFDVLYGQKGNDILDGGGRSDVMNGGAGDDTMTGGGGNDTFVFNRKAGDDEITDFADGQDLIDLSDFNLQNFNALNTSGAFSNLSGSGVLIDLSLIGGEGSITITGAVTVGNFSSADFIF